MLRVVAVPRSRVRNDVQPGRVEEPPQPHRIHGLWMVLGDRDDLVAADLAIRGLHSRGRSDDVAAVAAEVDVLARNLPRALLLPLRVASGNRRAAHPTASAPAMPTSSRTPRPGRAPSPRTRCRRGGRRRPRHRHPRRRRSGCRCSRRASVATSGSRASGRWRRPGSHASSVAACQAPRTGTPESRPRRTPPRRSAGQQHRPPGAPRRATTAAFLHMGCPWPRRWAPVVTGLPPAQVPPDRRRRRSRRSGMPPQVDPRSGLAGHAKEPRSATPRNEATPATDGEVGRDASCRGAEIPPVPAS